MPQNRRYTPEPPPLPKCKVKGSPPPPLPPPRVAHAQDNGAFMPRGIMEMLGLSGGLDSDRILLLGVLFLLSGEDCDRLLLMALLYILL